MGRVSAGKALLFQPEDGGAAGTTRPVTVRAGPRRWAVTAAWALGAVAAFACYLRLSRTRAVNSDGASQALQGWDMLHGNLLLHGWTLGDVSYYTTEVPQYALVELVRGLNSDDVHVAAAMTYTLVVLLAAVLAKGSATGRQGLVRALIAAGIMLAPQLSSGVNILLSSPDHIGTSAPVMAAWLVLDRARPRWYVPLIAGALLCWAMVADELVALIGVLPLAAVSAARALRAVVIQRKALAAQWYDTALGAAAVAAAAAAMLALRVIRAAGGFTMPAPATHLADGAILAHNLGVAGQGLLLLGGADFLGLRATAGTAFTVLHLAGVLVAACGTCLAAWRFPRDRDRVAQLLVAGVAVNLAAFVLSTRAGVVTQAREIAPVLPFSAALAGRLLGGPLLARRPGSAVAMPLLVLVMLGYLAGLAGEISKPAAVAQDQRLASWLEARHLHTGLSGYWEANAVTLASGDRVQVRLVNVSYRRGRLLPSSFEGKAEWYDPRRHAADFVVLFPGVAEYRGFTQEWAVLATFGTPARTYHVGGYTILVWNKNLLRSLG